MDQSELFKEIDLIQNCIERMTRNSFLIKGWSLTIFVTSSALLRKDVIDNTWLLFTCVIIPYFCFWQLDAFFLNTEKKYRQMYEWVLKNRKQGNLDFQYDLNPKRFGKKTSCVKTMFSRTQVVFYGFPIIAIIFAKWLL